MAILRIDSAPDELVLAIKSILRNHLYICKSYQQSISKEQIHGKLIERALTKREKEIMDLIAEGLSNNQISEKLNISPHSINNHRANIRSKLHLKGGKSALIQAAINSNNKDY